MSRISKLIPPALSKTFIRTKTTESSLFHLSQSQAQPQSSSSDSSPPKGPLAKEPEKTQLEKDEDLRQKLEKLSGGGGEAGLELENGKPVAMKRGVKENMFRLI